MTRQNQRLRRKYIFQCVNILTKVCKTSNGLAVYDEGWDDLKVMEEFNRVIVPREEGYNFTKVHVEGLRKEMIGNLVDKSPQGTKASAELEELKDRIERLEEWARLRPVGAFPSDPNSPIVPAPGAKGK